MTDRVDQASRVVRALPDKVYRAMTDAAALQQWLPPAGMSGKFERFDLQPGGGYRMVLTYDRPDPSMPGKAGADRDVVEVLYADIVPGERIEQLVDFESDDPAFAGRMRMTWLLARAGATTRVTIRCEDVPRGISAADHQAGLASSLENLAAFVE